MGNLLDREDLIMLVDKILNSNDTQGRTTEDIVEMILQTSETHDSQLHEVLDVVFSYSIQKEKRLHKIIEIILEYSTKISKERNNEILLIILADFGKKLVESDRATIWLIDENENVFWTKVAHGISNLKVPLTAGIIGEVYKSSETQIVNEPYSHPKFNPEVDKKTNYKTESILATPLFNKQNKMIGVFQAINKLNSTKKFTPEDSQLFTVVITYISNVLDVDHLAEENRYLIQEQTKAAQKQQSILVNELKTDPKVEVTIYFKPYDFLSGDSYSLHKTAEGGYLFYVLDAMGHGIVPSLTSFAVLSFVKKALDERLSFSDLASAFGKSLEYILSDLEQLSASFFYLDRDFKYVEYFTAGMYPAIVKDGDKIVELKANNIPFMNFFFSIKVSRYEINDFKAILVYTDGITEDSYYFVPKEDMPTMMDKDVLANYFEVIKDKKMEDDLTAVLIERKIGQ